MKYTADLRLTYEMEPGRPATLAETVLRREVGQLHLAIENGRGFGRTGVRKGSARVQILPHGPTS